MPQRVSDLLRMPEAGYSPEACLAFDEAALQFVLAWEARRDAREMVPLEKKSRKTRPMVPAPKYSEEELLRFLGIDPQDIDVAEMVAATLPQVGEADWDALDDWNEGEDGEVDDGDD